LARSYNLIQLPVDVETAFDFVSDFTNAAAWDPQAETVTKATEGPIGVGTRFDLVTANEADKWGAFGRLFAVQMHMTYEVLEMDRPGWLVLEGRTWYLWFRDEITFEATESGVDVHWRAVAGLRSLLWIGNPIFSLIFQKIADKAVSGMHTAIGAR
jgi:dehydrogenase/reductase SDR family protein 12